MCEFADDTAAIRPFGYREVRIGHAPAFTGDSAGLVVVVPPAVPSGKFRLLEKRQWRGMAFKAQTERIRKTGQEYNVTYIGIDATGVGAGVYWRVTS